MKPYAVTTAVLLGVWVLAGGALGVVELQEGRYAGLTVAFSSDVPQPDDPVQLMEDLKTFLTAGSAALSTAVSSGLVFGDVTVVVPRGWDFSSSFKGYKVTRTEATTNLTPATADILVHGEEASLPGTKQAELCGVPARQITLPLSFLSLTAAQQQQYGTPGGILAHEWAHYRWGIHDEHGYGGDDVFSSVYGTRQVTSCSLQNATVLGGFKRSCPDGSGCSPGTADCFFCFDEAVTADDVQASLGYLPALSPGQFCNATTHVRHTPTPQNVLCGQRSVMEVLGLHADYTRMAEATAATEPEMQVVQEALGRVLFLFDTPTSDATDLEIAQDSLLTVLKEALLSYGEVDIAMAAYRDDGSGAGVQMYNLMDFSAVTADNYDDLYIWLPTEEVRVAVPDVGQVLQQVLDHWEDYAPGTLVVLPVNNDIIAASQLDKSLGEALHARRIKPLFVYPEHEPLIINIASFLQYSGARFVFNNETNGNEYMSSVWSVPEVQKFIDYGYVNDHPIVKDDTVTLKKGGTYTQEILYQEHVVRTRMLVVTAPSVADLKLSYLKYGIYHDCDVCVTTDTTILMQQRSAKPGTFYGTEWGAQLQNNGDSDVEVTITWSEEYFTDKTDELDVQVWSSEGRGPASYIPENQNVVLYASVMNYGDQVLRTRIQVKVDLTIISATGQETRDLEGVELFDDGIGVDIKRDDSVYSVDLSENATDTIAEGSVIRVNALYVLGNIPYGRVQKTSSRVRSELPSPGGGSPQSSGLHPRDPSEEECCGSFVESPNIQLSHNIAGFHLVLRDVVPLGAVPGSGTASSSIALTRSVDPSYDVTTTTSTTTTTTTTGGPTTAPPTEDSTEAPTTITTTTTTTTTTTEPPFTGDKDGATSLSVESAFLVTIIAVFMHFVSSSSVL